MQPLPRNELEDDLVTKSPSIVRKKGRTKSALRKRAYSELITKKIKI